MYNNRVVVYTSGTFDMFHSNHLKMIEYARRLSEDFPQVRVDYYEIDDRLVFGELTFSSHGGIQSNYKKEYIKLFF